MQTEKLIMNMFQENTGTHFMDSGGERGRGWQREAGKKLQEYKDVPAIEWKIFGSGIVTSRDIVITVDTFHYLINVLEQDDLCLEFNKKFKKMNNWEGDKAYGISDKAEEWLLDNGFKVTNTWNTYNGDSFLDKVLQGAYLNFEGEDDSYPSYVLLQIHNGADVRGGYTDAKLFKLKSDWGINPVPDVYGTINGVQVDTSYDGYNLLDEEGKEVPLKKKGNKIFLGVSENF